MLRSPGYEAFITLSTESYPLKSIKIFREAFYMSFLFFMLSSSVLSSLMRGVSAASQSLRPFIPHLKERLVGN